MLISESSYSSNPFSSTGKSTRFNGEIFNFKLCIQYQPREFKLEIKKNINFNLEIEKIAEFISVR